MLPAHPARVILCFLGLLYAQQWSDIANAPTPRCEPVVEASGDCVYVVGGENQTVVESFCLTGVNEGVWSTKSSLPTNRTGTVSVLLNDQIFVMGGLQTTHGTWKHTVKLTEVYEIANDRWTTRSSMPSPMDAGSVDGSRESMAAVVHDGNMYVLGGYFNLLTQNNPRVPGKVLSTFSVYVTDLDQWSDMLPMPTAREELQAVMVGNSLLAIGGNSEDEQDWPEKGMPLDIVEEFDFNTGEWDTLTEMPTRRLNFGTGLVDGYVYVVGGRGFQGAGPFWFGKERTYDSVERYSPSIDKWETKGEMLQPLYGMGATVLNNTLYVVGGVSSTGQCQSALSVFDPTPRMSLFLKLLIVFIVLAVIAFIVFVVNFIKRRRSTLRRYWKHHEIPYFFDNNHDNL